MVEKKRAITFDAKSHTYRDEFNIVYTSVTTLIDKYAPKFDEDKWAAIKAKQAGVSVEVIKRNWKNIREYACDKGNKTHGVLEDSINSSYSSSPTKVQIKTEGTGLVLIINETNLFLLANSPLASKYPKVYQYLKKKIEDGWILHAEKRVYWAEYCVAGTIDCLLVKGKFFIIVDWKTNKDTLSFKSGYYKKVNGIKSGQWIDKKEYMFAPIAHLEHCKGIKYTLQLSMYAYIMELWGFQCIGLELFHIRDDGEVRQYSITYEQKASELLLIHNKTGLTPYNLTKKSTNQDTGFGIF